MKTPLPTNEDLIAFSAAVPWGEIERKKRQFNRAIETATAQTTVDNDIIPLDALSEAIDAPVTTLFDASDSTTGNVLLTEKDGFSYVLGSTVSKRYRSGQSFLESVTPYNLNPSVNHTNIDETDDPETQMRVLGAELELGLVHPDGGSPTEDTMQEFMRSYFKHAQRIGIYPRLDREACQYQVEAHIAPSIGYNKARASLNGIFTALVLASEDTNVQTAILSCYPTDSDFKMTDHAKVHTAVDLLGRINGMFPDYANRLATAKERFHIKDPAHHVNVFRNQGCHIHIDLAGRSEALGMLTFYTLLKSATAVANAAVLKGGPFVNGTCDTELLCARGYLRNTTVTGRYLDHPTSPHFSPNGMDDYSTLLYEERVNAAGRAMLCDTTLGTQVSAMHNPIGRIRPDLSTQKRVCTVEAMGMPVNVSPSRLAAILIDMEFSHTIIEDYFRKHGCDLEPMYNDRNMWAVLGPLDEEAFVSLNDQSDRLGTDMIIRTAVGTEMTLAEFYEMKRRFMHRALADISEITPREIDEVYTSLNRMLEPLSGQQAETIQQYILDPKLRSTGNWGKILRNAYLEKGGTLGAHDPDRVLQVVNDVHNALRTRYLG